MSSGWFFVCFFKQKTAYEMRISDWSSDVCSSDLMILKRMKRRHSRAQSVAIVERLKAARPDIAIGADLIAGFTTETEAMAANTRALIADCDIVHAHLFPFSERAGKIGRESCRHRVSQEV